MSRNRTGALGVRRRAPPRHLAEGDDQRTGELLACAHTRDVVNGHRALDVEDGDRVLTSDADDLGHLLTTRRIAATVVQT